MATKKDIKLAFQTLSSEASEWDAHGYEPGDPEYASQNKHNNAIHQLGDMFEKHETAILALIHKLNIVDK